MACLSVTVASGAWRVKAYYGILLLINSDLPIFSVDFIIGKARGVLGGSPATGSLMIFGLSLM
jgi:hypothetical protein